jgi:hypothetical protein
MIKCLMVLALFGLLGAAVVASPGSASRVEAREPTQHMMLLVQHMAQNDCVSTLQGDTSESTFESTSLGQELAMLSPTQPEVAK